MPAGGPFEGSGRSTRPVLCLLILEETTMSSTARIAALRYVMIATGVISSSGSIR